MVISYCDCLFQERQAVDIEEAGKAQPDSGISHWEIPGSRNTGEIVG